MWSLVLQIVLKVIEIILARSKKKYSAAKAAMEFCFARSEAVASDKKMLDKYQEVLSKLPK